jgi:serine protease Do
MKLIFPIYILRGRWTCLLWSFLILSQCHFAQAQSTQEAIAQVSPRMVKIFGAGGIQRLQGYCTGFLVSPQGHIATVWSHVLDQGEVSVVLDSGRKLTAKVIGAEPRLDLAILKIDGDELPYFDLDLAADAATPGTRVLAFSNMFNVASGNEPVTVLHGVIAARTKLEGRRGVFDIAFPAPVYIVDAITNNSGSLGGVLTTRDGRLLAMIGKELRNAQSNTWVNYAMPIAELKDPIQEIIAGKYAPVPAKLADTPETAPRHLPLDFGLVMIPDVVARTPAYVEEVTPNSVAAQAGIKTDDLILFVNGELIQSCRHLMEVCDKLEDGTMVDFVLRRDGKLETIKLVVPEKPVE